MTYTLSVGLHNQMRIKHKYLRNKHICNKYWNRVRSREHPFETFMPSWYGGKCHWDADYQIKNQFENIVKEVRGMDKGHRRPYFRNSSSSFRRILNKHRKAKTRNAIARIRNGDFDHEMPTFKRDAAWMYW